MLTTNFNSDIVNKKFSKFVLKVKKKKINKNKLINISLFNSINVDWNSNPKFWNFEYTDSNTLLESRIYFNKFKHVNISKNHFSKYNIILNSLKINNNLFETEKYVLNNSLYFIEQNNLWLTKFYYTKQIPIQIKSQNFNHINKLSIFNKNFNKIKLLNYHNYSSEIWFENYVENLDKNYLYKNNSIILKLGQLNSIFDYLFYWKIINSKKIIQNTNYHNYLLKFWNLDKKYLINKLSLSEPKLIYSENKVFELMVNNLYIFSNILDSDVNFNKIKIQKNTKYDIKKNTEISYYLSNLNLRYLSIYYWDRLNKIKSFGKSQAQVNNTWVKRSRKISTIISSLKDSYIFGDGISTGSKIDLIDLNNKLAPKFETFLDSYQTSLKFNNITIYDGKFLNNYQVEKKKIISTSFDIFVEKYKIYNKSNINFSNIDNMFNYIKKLYYLNPENVLYNAWDFTILIFKYVNIGYSSKNINIQKLLKNSGHIKNNLDIFINKSLVFKTKKVIPLIFNQIKKHNISYNNKSILKNSNIDFNYKDWSSNFGLLENKFSNLVKSNCINTNNIKNINKLKYSNVDIINLESTLQRLEQMALTHLGNNYMREIIYSHYGSWIPKYGIFFIKSSSLLNPNGLNSWENKNYEILDKYVKSNDWIKYFEYKNSIKNQGEIDFIKNYIFLKNKYIHSDIYKNFSNYSYWLDKKLVYRPFDSYIEIFNKDNSQTIENVIFSKLWGWIIRDDWALRYNYFKYWNYLQKEKELLDIKKFGKISQKTHENNFNNPEIFFIEIINECVYNYLFIENLEILSKLDIKENEKITKLVRKSAINCFKHNSNLLYSNQEVLQKLELLYNNDKISEKNIFNQSDILENNYKHDTIVNEFRIKNWKSKFKK